VLHDAAQGMDEVIVGTLVTLTLSGCAKGMVGKITAAGIPFM
jgi:hypothetical protein